MKGRDGFLVTTRGHALTLVKAFTLAAVTHM